MQHTHTQQHSNSNSNINDKYNPKNGTENMNKFNMSPAFCLRHILIYKTFNGRALDSGCGSGPNNRKLKIGLNKNKIKIK